jgi:cation transport ATPase
MLEYVHFILGRLRLKITNLRHKSRAADAEAKVGAIRGVTAARANPLTGSLTINFDRSRLSIGELWKELQELGYVPETCPQPENTGCVSASDPDRHRFGRLIPDALIEAVIQHSAQTLIRAFL